MHQGTNDLRLTMWLAMAGSGGMIAHQVAAKAARDGFFLQNFEPTDLPRMVVLAALLSFGFAVLFSRGNERFGPARLVPASFAISGVVHVAEFFAMPAAPKPVSVLIYLHVVGPGAVLLSGFWLLLSEVFDLREAKKRFGRIAGIGTAGGIAGGLLAERLVAWSASSYLLVLLAVLHLSCAAIAMQLRPPRSSGRRGHGHHGSSKPQGVSAKEAFQRTPLLWQLASLVFLGTCTAALLDYLFKLGATSTIGKGPALVRYFAIYYTSCQVLTFLLQTFLAKPAVERLGVAKSVASLPVAVGLGSTVALLVPVYPLVVVLRGIEVILRGSLFRSGYEFLYTPVPPTDKRAVKTIVDVGFDRIGDAAGAGAVQVMVWLGPTLARPEILGLAMVLTAASTALALRLNSSYRGVLERGLVERAREEEDGGDSSASGVPSDDTLMNTVFDGMPSLASLQGISLKADRSGTGGTVTSSSSGDLQTGGSGQTAFASQAAVSSNPQWNDPTLERMIELRSRDARRVAKALGPHEPWDPLLAPQAIRLLAWDDVSAHARNYLERGGRRILGQIQDALIDQDLDFAIRRRLPRLLARVPAQPSVDALIAALEDPRFEIRYQCGRALDYMQRHHGDLDFRASAVFNACERELSVSQAIWASRPKAAIHDSAHSNHAGGSSSDSYDFLDDVVRERADRSLEHVFSLFAVVLPREPLMAAFRALHQDDRMFRGLALEYLENVLPDVIRRKLWVILEESPPEAGTSEEARQRAHAALLETHAALLLKIRREEVQYSRSEGHAAVLTAEQRSDPKPGQSEPHIEPGKARETHG